MNDSAKIVMQVYHEHISKFGEPARSVSYENPPSDSDDIYPSSIDVMVWSPDNEVNITTFATIGMSEKVMQGADHRAELHFSVEGTLGTELTSEITMFMANLSLYPFMNNTYFDWGYTLPGIGKVPGFPAAGSLLLHPAFMEDGWDLISTDDAEVKIINVIPVTQKEYMLSKEKGINAMLDYMDENNISFFQQR